MVLDMPDDASRHVPCSATTKQGDPCPINADRVHGGFHYCHVHDPEGTFRKQVQGRESADAPGPWETKTTTTTDGGHAKAELALRFLEFSCGLLKAQTDEQGLKELKALQVRCMTIIEEYFQP